jgi:hypothetical protein
VELPGIMCHLDPYHVCLIHVFHKRASEQLILIYSHLIYDISISLASAWDEYYTRLTEIESDFNSGFKGHVPKH